MIGKKIYNLAKTLFPINRSITGDGVRETLRILKKVNPSLKIKNIDSGTKIFNWTVPQEWNVKAAWIKDAREKLQDSCFSRAMRAAQADHFSLRQLQGTIHAEHPCPVDLSRHAVDHCGSRVHWRLQSAGDQYY